MSPRVIHTNSKILIDAIKLIPTSRRYSLLAYFTTIIVANEPVVRPMLHHFAAADLTATEQFLLGEHLMVVPILRANLSYTEKEIYFPDKFFDFRFGYAIPDAGPAKYPIHASPLLIFVRAGRIVPVHRSRVGAPVSSAHRVHIEIYYLSASFRGPTRLTKRDSGH